MDVWGTLEFWRGFGKRRGERGAGDGEGGNGSGVQDAGWRIFAPLGK